MTRNFNTSEIAYDLIQHTPVVITDAHGSRLGDVRPALRETIERNHGNKLIGLDAETSIVDVAYLSIDGPATKTYALPTTRLVRPDVSTATDGLSAFHLAQTETLRQLYQATDDGEQQGVLTDLCGLAGIPEDVVNRAQSNAGAE